MNLYKESQATLDKVAELIYFLRLLRLRADVSLPYLERLTLETRVTTIYVARYTDIVLVANP